MLLQSVIFTKWVCTAPTTYLCDTRHEWFTWGIVCEYSIIAFLSRNYAIKSIFPQVDWGSTVDSQKMWPYLPKTNNSSSSTPAKRHPSWYCVQVNVTLAEPFCTDLSHLSQHLRVKMKGFQLCIFITLTFSCSKVQFPMHFFWGSTYMSIVKTIPQMAWTLYFNPKVHPSRTFPHSFRWQHMLTKAAPYVFGGFATRHQLVPCRLSIFI